MGFGLLAGIAGAFPAIQRGIDDQKARDAADEDRKYQLEQREAARSDRAFGLQQRDRQVAEQRRQDNLRSELAAVPQTREVDVRPQEVLGITHDDTTGPDETTPAATQVPATKTLAAPDWMKFKSTADVLRRNQEFEKADAYDALSKKAQFAESAQRFERLKATSSGMTLEQLARAASDIYNSDPLPAQVEGVSPTAGGLKITFSNKETGRSESLVVRDQAELLRGLEAYYSPDTWAAYRQAQIKAAADAAKPRKLAPGEIEVTGAAPGRNDTPTAAQLRYGAGGAGAGTGGRATKPDDAFKAVTDAWENVAKNSGFKDQATPVQAATSQRLARQFFKESSAGLDPAFAVEAAMDATLNPDKLFPRFDPRSGQVVMAYEPQSGGLLVAERLGDPKSPRGVKPEQMRKVAQDFLERSVPEDSRQLFVAAASSADGKRRLHEEISRRLSSPEGVAMVTRDLGRQADEADIERKVKEAMEALGPQIALLEAHLDPKIKGTAEKVERKRAEVSKEADARKAASEMAAKLLADKTEAGTRALFKLQGSDEFQYLDKDTQTAIWARVNKPPARQAGGLYQAGR